MGSQRQNTDEGRMTPGRVLLNVCIVLVVLALLIGVPFTQSALFQQLTADQAAAPDPSAEAPDAEASSASGEFLVFINCDFHADEAQLAAWQAFFAGEKGSVPSETASLSVAEGDAAAYAQAQAYQSQLPKDQLAVRQEGPITLLSKAEGGCFDMLLMSREMADVFHGENVLNYQGASMFVVTSTDGPSAPAASAADATTPAAPAPSTPEGQAA